MSETDLISVLSEWSASLIRFSLHDFNRFARKAGLSLAQMNILMHIHYQGPNEVLNFCEMMQISPAGASQMIERMVQQGVVQRLEAAGDRRVRLVSLTDAGREVVLECIAARQVWLEQIAAGIPASEQQLLAEALARLNQQASRLEVHPV